MRFINNQARIIVVKKISSGSGESYDFSILSEAFSAKEKVVFSDKTHLAFTVSAFSAIFTEFSCVSSPE
jgi:hypothetical protein